MLQSFIGKMWFVLLMTAVVSCDNPIAGRSSTSAKAEPATDIRLATVADESTFDRPVGIERRSGRPDKLYIVEQAGRIRMLDLARPDADPVTVLDITDRVHDDGNEQGLLGLAFHPSKPGLAFVNYTTATHTVVSRFQAKPEQGDRLDAGSEQVVLAFRQPFANHNGGQLVFGPDKLLYIGTGDGGSGGDPQGNAQNRSSLLGKILRIDVDRRAGKRAYAIPADNPFAKGGGAPEVYAYGLRNPWRFSFDAVTGQLWAADVGQNKLEEIDLIRKGGNYGWNVMEATACYNPEEGCQKEGLIPPIYEYGRDSGVSVTGGFVYRGKQVPNLTGWYVYTDYATGTIWGLRQRKDGSPENRTMLESGANITSFGIDGKNELYVCTQDGAILKFQPA